MLSFVFCYKNYSQLKCDSLSYSIVFFIYTTKKVIDPKKQKKNGFADENVLLFGKQLYIIKTSKKQE